MEDHNLNASHSFEGGSQGLCAVFAKGHTCLVCLSGNLWGAAGDLNCLHVCHSINPASYTAFIRV